MVANLHPPKDQATLIRAWRIVCDQVCSDRRAVLVLAGRFVSSHNELFDLAGTLRIQDAIRFPGAVRDVSGLLAAADIGAFSSHYEGMPNGLMECMACSLPVVASNLPGICEALGPNCRDSVVPPGDARAFARVLIELIENPWRRRQLGERNRRRIQDCFSPSSMAEQFVDAIARTLGPTS
jgi:glycosyltransferase involved in cell wall biosynthesis